MKGERADWKAIRAEYIKDERTSYRSLAKKHSVSLAALVKRAINEKWVELRKQKKNKSITKFIEKTSDEESEKLVSINDVANNLLAKINEIIEVSALINSQSIKQLTSALKDIKDIKGDKKDELDNETTGVVFLPSVVGEEVTEDKQ